MELLSVKVQKSLGDGRCCAAQPIVLLEWTAYEGKLCLLSLLRLFRLQWGSCVSFTQWSGTGCPCLAGREHAGEIPVLALCSGYHCVPEHILIAVTILGYLSISAALDSCSRDCCFQTWSLCHSPVNGSCFAFVVHGAPKESIKLPSLFRHHRSHSLQLFTFWHRAHRAAYLLFCMCWPQHWYSRQGWVVAYLSFLWRFLQDSHFHRVIVVRQNVDNWSWTELWILESRLCLGFLCLAPMFPCGLFWWMQHTETSVGPLWMLLD